MIEEIINSFKEEDLEKGGYFYKDGITLYVSDEYKEFKEKFFEALKTNSICELQDNLSYFMNMTLFEITICGFVNMQGEYQELISGSIDLIYERNNDSDPQYYILINAKENVYSTDYLCNPLNIEKAIKDLFDDKNNVEYMTGYNYVELLEDYYSFDEQDDIDCIRNLFKGGIKYIFISLINGIRYTSAYDINKYINSSQLPIIEKRLFALNSIANFIYIYNDKYEYNYKQKRIEIPNIIDSEGNVIFCGDIMKYLVKTILSRIMFNKIKRRYYGGDLSFFKENKFDIAGLLMDEDIDFNKKVSVLYESLLEGKWVGENEMQYN